jgi:outer membrane protein OmpA-like peptidoglycan-associated protein
LATQLKQFDQLNSVKITGHTDYLGSDAYNLRLSEQRAQTVRQYLIAQGLPANKIYAVGMGESQAVKQCASTGNRSALIACLQPNRRVEVEVDGSGVVK